MNSAAPPVVAEHNANLLLAALPPQEMARMLPALDQVKVDVGAVLCEPGDTIHHIYFPHDCLISLMAVAEGRMTLEVGLVGREGMLGATVALGHETTQVRAVVQQAFYGTPSGTAKHASSKHKHKHKAGLSNPSSQGCVN